MKRDILATLAAGVWINLCEFLRNELILKQQWLDKYQSLGLTFPSAPTNGILWVVWGFVLAACILAAGRRTPFIQTFVVIWTVAFPLMWIVTWNLNVLPLRLLLAAVPWSMAEVALGILLTTRIAGKQAGERRPPRDAEKTDEYR